MRKTLIISSILSLLFFVSCDIESSNNGKLDGFWYLNQVDSLSKATNLDKQRIFWSFQYDLLQLSNLNDNTIIYRFEKNNNRLILKNPCMFDRTLGDTLVTDVEVLRPYGVNSLNETFNIVNLSNSDMILESPVLRLHFIKH
jgi:hypothetical protein